MNKTDDKIVKTLLPLSLGLIMATSCVNASDLATIKNATYMLYMSNGGTCSGQFISETQFLTALHCYDKNSTHTIEMFDAYGELHKPVLELSNILVDADLAIFSFDMEKYQLSPDYVDVGAIDWANTMQWGEELLVASYPNGIYLTPVPATFIGRSESGSMDARRAHENSINAILMAGSSGGGLYRWSESDGYLLVGVMLSILIDQPSIANFAMPTHIVAIMDGANREVFDDRG